MKNNSQNTSFKLALANVSNIEEDENEVSIDSNIRIELTETLKNYFKCSTLNRRQIFGLLEIENEEMIEAINDHDLNIKLFKKLMNKSELEDYTHFLLFEISVLLEIKKSGFAFRTKDERNHGFKQQKELIKTLLILFNTKEVPSIQIKFKEKLNHKPINLSDKNIYSVIINELLRNIKIVKNKTNTIEDITKILKEKLAIIEKRILKTSSYKGKHSDNESIVRLLSNIIRLPRLLDPDNNFSKIEDIPYINKDYRFIHDGLVILKLIEDKSIAIKNGTSKSTPEKYIKATFFSVK